MEVTPLPKPGKKPKKKKGGFKTPAKTYCVYCGKTYGIERHHVSLTGMGGSKVPEQHTDSNRLDLCLECHRAAHAHEAGYLVDDLLKKKAEDEQRIEMGKKLLNH